MEEIVDLTAAGTALLETARASSAGRAAKPVLSTPVLKSVLIALRAGCSLAEHAAPPAAALHCLVGQARLHAGQREWLLGPGDFAAIPQERHGVDGTTDCVVLLTIAAGRAPEPVELELNQPG